MKVLKNKLKGIMIYHNDTQENLSKALGLAVATLSYKMNGRTEFTRQEISKIKERYNLTAEELDDIFFND